MDFRMKEVLHLFLCFMISFGLARDGQTDLKEKSRTYDQGIQIWKKYPYIDPKCCNFSTTARCSRMGSDGFKGHCTPRNETCLGREYYGSKYCVISKHQSCKCCVPTDCKRQILSPCSTLNGTCIGLNDLCNGTSLVSGEFCKRDSKIDTCKCCFPLVPKEEKEECPCGQDYNGRCLGFYPGGKEAIKGRCMKTCALGHAALRNHTCNKTGGKDCKCCEQIDACSETCKSSCASDELVFPGWCSGLQQCCGRVSSSCQKPFKKIGSEFLYFHDSSKKNWDDALKHCRSIGGSLAEPANMEEFIHLINSSYFDMRPTIWLGATDRSTEQNWKWLSGGSVPSSLWPVTPVNQPDGDGDCMEIHYRFANGYTGFYLNDYKCDVEGYFVCECTPRITTD